MRLWKRKRGSSNGKFFIDSLFAFVPFLNVVEEDKPGRQQQQWQAFYQLIICCCIKCSRGKEKGVGNDGFLEKRQAMIIMASCTNFFVILLHSTTQKRGGKEVGNDDELYQLVVCFAAFCNMVRRR